MTVSSTVNKIQYVGDGVSDIYTYPFRIFQDSDLHVTVDAVDQVLNTDYTVTGAGDLAGGTIIFESGSIPADQSIILINRAVPITQLIDYVDYDRFPAEVHEAGLDKGIIISQQQQEQLDRALLGEPGSSFDFTYSFGDAAERASKLWSFDETGLLVIAIDTAEEKAYRWAETDESVVVENRDGRDRYSAYHWAQKAEAVSDLPLTAKGDLLSHDGSGYSVVSQASLGGVNGDLLVIDDSQPEGFNYSTPVGVLPPLSAGDKLKILKVKVDETGYELTPNYDDHLVHAKDMLNDDESGSEITAFHVAHYGNTAMLFENPSSDAAGAQCWINGLIVRRHDALNYALRLRVAKTVGDANAGDVVFQAQAFLFPPAGSLNPSGLTAITSTAVTLPANDADGVDITLSGVIPLGGADLDVMASISIKRMFAGNTYVGQVDVVLAELEIE